MTFHTTNRQIIISGYHAIAHLYHNNYGPASRNATANRRQPTPRSTAPEGSLQPNDSQAVSETAEIFDQNKLFWSPVWYLLHCNLVLIRDQNKLFWSMAAKRLSTAKPKRGTGRIQIMLFAASCAAAANKKKGRRKFGYSAASPYFCGRKL